jgi:hypothetical protein
MPEQEAANSMAETRFPASWLVFSHHDGTPLVVNFRNRRTVKRWTANLGFGPAVQPGLVPRRAKDLSCLAQHDLANAIGSSCSRRSA